MRSLKVGFGSKAAFASLHKSVRDPPGSSRRDALSQGRREPQSDADSPSSQDGGWRRSAQTARISGDDGLLPILARAQSSAVRLLAMLGLLETVRFQAPLHLLNFGEPPFDFAN